MRGTLIKEDTVLKELPTRGMWKEVTLKKVPGF